MYIIKETTKYPIIPVKINASGKFQLMFGENEKLK
jgi:hypothetical protein